MSTPLLTTKLYIPPVRPNLVPRLRLIERLNAGLHCKLTLISAPAGFGKTTLLSEWVYHGRGESRTRPLVAWVSLDEGDNDSARFLAYLVAALQTVRADVGKAALAVLQSPQPLPMEAVLTTLVNEVAAVSQGDRKGCPYVLVLDDYHAIKAQPIHNALTFLLDHLPANMHLVIATCADPPLSLARWRGRGQIAELREADLRFTTDEAAAFPYQVMGLGLSAEDVATLAARTEGWIAGLPLAAGNFEGAARLVEQIAPTMLWMRGEVATLLGWLAALPEELVRSRPRLCLAHAWVLLTIVQLDAVEKRLQEAERALAGGADHATIRNMLGEVAVMRAMVANFRGDIPRTVELCHQAMERVPEDNLFLRSIIAGNLGGAYVNSGDVVAAGRAFAEAARLSQAAGNTFTALIALSYLGDTQVIQGQLRNAAKTYQEALELAPARGEQQLPCAGVAHAGMGGLLCEWNNLDTAMRHLKAGIELSERLQDTVTGPGLVLVMLSSGYVALARVLQAQGDFGGASQQCRHRHPR